MESYRVLTVLQLAENETGQKVGSWPAGPLEVHEVRPAGLFGYDRLETTGVRRDNGRDNRSRQLSPKQYAALQSDTQKTSSFQGLRSVFEDQLLAVKNLKVRADIVPLEFNGLRPSAG